VRPRGPPTRRSDHRRGGVAASTSSEEGEVVVVMSSGVVRDRGGRRWWVGVGRPRRTMDRRREMEAAPGPHRRLPRPRHQALEAEAAAPHAKFGGPAPTPHARFARGRSGSGQGGGADGDTGEEVAGGTPCEVRRGRADASRPAPDPRG
jgi:hypothetical protein